VMTKFLSLGYTLPEVVEGATVAAARAIRRDDLGHLGPGAPGDVSVIRLTETPIDLEDVEGEIVPFDKRLDPVGVAIAGTWRPA
jgi:dihydroorotase